MECETLKIKEVMAFRTYFVKSFSFLKGKENNELFDNTSIVQKRCLYNAFLKFVAILSEILYL